MLIYYIAYLQYTNDLKQYYLVKFTLMSRIFFVSLKPKLGDFSSFTIEQAYGRIGKNTGNLLFTNAVWSQLQYDGAESGYVFDPVYVNENFDHMVIPAANWLYENFDFSDLASLIEQVTIPVVMIGVGAQAGIDKTIPVLPKGTVRLVEAVSERSALIGARGSFSAEVLEHYGIKNVEIIGCPSLYYGHDGDLTINKSGFERIITGGTRYYFSAHDKTKSGMAQNAIYQFAFNERLDINYQSERPEFDYILSNGQVEIERSNLKQAYTYYGCRDAKELLDYVSSHGKVFTDVNEWVASMREYDFYIGSRIHGVIATLLSGTPGCLLAHDSRTKELADFASIPSFSHDEIDELSMSSVEEIYNYTDYSAFQSFIRRGYLNYIKFLNKNSLPHNLTIPAENIQRL